MVDEEIFQRAFLATQQIFPLHRSISGVGINHAFDILKDQIGGKLLKYPTGYQAFDWVIPNEWACNDVAIYCLDDRGDRKEKIVTFDHPLRVASHSCAVHKTYRGDKLKEKLAVSKKNPNNLLHRYIYYREDWSISVTMKEYEMLRDDKHYEVIVDVNEYSGELKVHEKCLKGTKSETIFLLSHICHPAQFNDGLAGVFLNIYLCLYMQKFYPKPLYTYKFLAFPETIGSHAYCSQVQNVENSWFAIFSEMTALDQPLHIQRSKCDSDYVNELIALAVDERELEAKSSPFLKVIRNDEKVFNSPGIDIPAASITRALGPGHADHPYREYHTDGDNIQSADLGKFREVIELYQTLIYIVENDFVVERNFDGIPMLSRHDLFVDPLVDRDGYNIREALVWELTSNRRISSISSSLNRSFSDILEILIEWQGQGLVELK